MSFQALRLIIAIVINIIASLLYLSNRGNNCGKQEAIFCFISEHTIVNLIIILHVLAFPTKAVYSHSRRSLLRFRTIKNQCLYKLFESIHICITL